MWKRGLGRAPRESEVDEKRFNEAVAWVRYWFGWQLEAYPDGRPPIVTQMYEHSKVVGIASDTRDGHLRIEEVIERSRSRGGTLEWDGLSLLAQWLLRENAPLPPPLANWLADVLAGKTPRRGKGQRPSATARQIVIVDAIEWTIRALKCKPTRSNAAVYPYCCSEQASGCDIVGVALGRHMPEWKTEPPRYKTIESLWLRRKTVRSRAKRENPPSPSWQQRRPVGTHYRFEYHEEPPKIEYDDDGNPHVVTPPNDEISIRAVVRTDYDDRREPGSELRTEFDDDGKPIGSEK